MVNIIFSLLIIIAIIFGILSNNLDIINDVILEAPKDSFTMMINIGVMIVLWSGILEVARRAGILELISRILKKILLPLFPNTSDKAMEFISSNVAANMLGLGSCATPLGIKAMEELQKENENKTRATKKMITLLILNTSGLTLIPETILSLRKMYDAKITVEIIPYVMLCSIVTSFLAIFLDYLFRRRIK